MMGGRRGGQSEEALSVSSGPSGSSPGAGAGAGPGVELAAGSGECTGSGAGSGAGSAAAAADWLVELVVSSEYLHQTDRQRTTLQENKPQILVSETTATKSSSFTSDHR